MILRALRRGARAVRKGRRFAEALVLAAVVLCAGTIYYVQGIPDYEPPKLPQAQAMSPMRPASGPLRRSPVNPRYFTDGTGRAVLLVGAHTWSNLQDNGLGDPPPKFDYERYLDFLTANHLNFFRLWAWGQARWAPWVKTDDYYFYPGPPYRRTGPGLALDGKPRFDLHQFNPAYFSRLRSRVVQAGRRGIYVSIMLFNGWSIDGAHSHLKGGNPWHGHPFNKANNVNGIDGDPNGNDGGEETQQLTLPAVTAIQEEYVRRVVDAVSDLDNVLFEISNESYASSRDWQYHMIDFIHRYEATRPKQHPVGMSQYQWPGRNADLFNSPADWIAPWQELPNGAYRDDPPPADGTKVVIADTDHLWGIGGDRKWAWKTFLRGNQVSFMDAYDGASVGCGAPAPWDIRMAGWKEIVEDILHLEPRSQGWQPDAPQWVSLRANMGYILRFAERMDLAAMTPQPGISSTRYALASSAPAAEFLIYTEDSKQPIEVDLSACPCELKQEWFDPATGRTVAGPDVEGGSRRLFESPFSEDAVLYLHAAGATPTGTGASR